MEIPLGTGRDVPSLLIPEKHFAWIFGYLVGKDLFSNQLSACVLNFLEDSENKNQYLRDSAQHCCFITISKLLQIDKVI